MEGLWAWEIWALLCSLPAPSGGLGLAEAWGASLSLTFCLSPLLSFVTRDRGSAPAQRGKRDGYRGRGDRAECS